MRGYRCRAPSVAASPAPLLVWVVTLASACGSSRGYVKTESGLILTPNPPPSGTIASISIGPPTSTPILGDVVNFTIAGNGVCGYMHVYFGDGSMFDYSNRSLDNGLSVNHAYQTWGGVKTVTVDPVWGCTGAAQTTITVTPTVFVIVEYPGTGCGLLNWPPVRKGSTVHVTSPKINNTPDPDGHPTYPGINFGGTGGGVPISPNIGYVDVFEDADGENAPAPAGSPFPGLRNNSLVLRINQQVVQGGTDVSFVAAETSLMEFCINHTFPAGYKSSARWDEGFWRYSVVVTEPPF